MSIECVPVKYDTVFVLFNLSFSGSDFVYCASVFSLKLVQLFFFVFKPIFLVFDVVFHGHITLFTFLDGRGHLS